MSSDLSTMLPRVLIVSRRSVRKNKFVDFVGEYHLDLIVSYGAVPVIVPRVSGIHMLLDNFEPIHGVLLCEGEDIDPCLYESQDNNTSSCLSHEELEEIKKFHSNDTNIDKEKDSIEFTLAKLCLERNIPYLGICRGSQLLNVACGGTLYRDIGKELSNKLLLLLCVDESSTINKNKKPVMHINYDDYDGHRHAIEVVENTPLYQWFKDEKAGGKLEILVNSYHHQGVKKLAQRFVPMAFSHDGLIEGFYDPNAYFPEEGKFIMGLQFHPERMRKPYSDEFDYPGCTFAYKEFVKAVIAFQKRLNNISSVPKPLKVVNKEIDNKRKIIMRSFSCQLEAAAEFLESNTGLSVQQDNRLEQMGARNGVERLLNLNEEKIGIEKMSVEQLSELTSFYHTMGQICSQVLERKLHDVVVVNDTLTHHQHHFLSFPF